MRAQGIKEGAVLPQALQVDPGTLSDAQRKQQGIRDLPRSLEAALASLEVDSGDMLRAFICRHGK